MDAFFTEILQLIVKALLIFLLARTSNASPKTVAQTHVDRKTAVTQKTVMRPAAAPRPQQQTKKATR